MTIMSDNWIKKMSVEEGMIEPFVDAQKKEGTISYGVSSYVTTSEKFCMGQNTVVINPRNINSRYFAIINKV